MPGLRLTVLLEVPSSYHRFPEPPAGEGSRITITPSAPQICSLGNLCSFRWTELQVPKGAYLPAMSCELIIIFCPSLLHYATVSLALAPTCIAPFKDFKCDPCVLVCCRGTPTSGSQAPCALELPFSLHPLLLHFWVFSLLSTLFRDRPP